MNKTEQLDSILKDMWNCEYFASQITLREWANNIEL